MPASIQLYTKSDEIDALAKTKDPKHLFAAFKIVNECTVARYNLARKDQDETWDSHEKGKPTADEICATITPGQMTQASQWVEVAAEAGVHGAAYANYLNAVAHRDEYSSEAAAQFRRYNLELYQRSALTGDRTAIHELMTYYAAKDGGNDKLQALTYAVAWDEAVKAGLPPTEDDRYAPMAVQAFESGLPPDKVAAATAAGGRLIADARMTPQWGS